MSIPLSVVSTVLHLANAAGFILLAPGPALADYISASIVYGTAMWLCVWVLPTVWDYDPARVGLLRGLQLLVVVAAQALLLISHPNAIGLIFSVMLVVEVVAFLPYLMLFQSRSSTLIHADFVRALLNTTGLVGTVFLWGGAPAAYASSLLVSLILVSGTLAITGIHRAPLPAPRIRQALSGGSLRTALRSRSLRQLLGARTIEVIATLSLNAAGALGAILALKVGSVAVQATAFNARRLSLTQALGLGSALYLAGIASILIANAVAPGQVPATLRLIGLVDVLIAVAPFIAMLVLTVLSIKQKPVAPEVRGAN